jgi:hypothetical protein
MDASAPEETSAKDAAPEVAPVAVSLTSCLPTSYLVPVTMGGSQKFQFALDTGSTTMAVASSTCLSCDVTPTYTPGSSAVDEQMTTSSVYELGGWKGEVYQDTAKVGSAPVVLDKFAAIDSQSQFFQGSFCGGQPTSPPGIIGFGPTATAVPDTIGIFDQLVSLAHVPDIFATELCQANGTLWLGGYDVGSMTAPPQYTPITTSGMSEFYYTVGFKAIEVAGTSVPIATADYTDSIIDTGTSVIFLPPGAFSQVVAAIAAVPAFSQLFGAATIAQLDAGIGDAGGAVDAADASPDAANAVIDAKGAQWFLSQPGNCVGLAQTKAELDAMLPPLTLVFGSDPSISVNAPATESYLLDANVDNLWCSTLAPQTPTAEFPNAATLGAPILRSNIVIFDRKNQRIGFAPHTPCPTFMLP